MGAAVVCVGVRVQEDACVRVVGVAWVRAQVLASRAAAMRSNPGPHMPLGGLCRCPTTVNEQKC